MYAAVISFAIVITATLNHFFGDAVMTFLSNQLGPFILNSVGSTAAIVGVLILVVYGLARNNGRLLKELLEKEK